MARRPAGFAWRLAIALCCALAGSSAAVAQAPSPAAATGDEARRHFLEAVRHFEEGRLSEARAAAELALEKDPNQNEALHLLGHVHFRGRFYKLALEHFEEALRRQPESASLHYSRGEALKSLGREDEALAEYEASVRLGPTFYRPHYEIGVIQLNRSEFDKADAAFRQSLELHPGEWRAHYQRGLIHMRRGQPGAAIELFRTVLRLEPYHMSSRYNLAQALLRAGKTEEGEKELAEYRRLLRDSDEATREKREQERVASMLGHGKECLEQGDVPRALELFRGVLSREPDNADALFYLAQAYQRIGDLDRAKQALDASRAARAKAAPAPEATKQP